MINIIGNPPKKNLENPYKYPWKSEEKERKKKKENMEKYSVNIPYCEGLKPNIEGLTSFEKKRSEMGRRKEKRRKNSNL